MAVSVSDADRLRQAADRLDGESATYWDGAQGKYVPIRSRQDEIVADLLLALADYHDRRDCFCAPSWQDPVTGKRVPSTVDYPCAVALDLADVILGEPSRPPNEDFSKGGQPIPELVDRLRAEREAAVELLRLREDMEAGDD